jgi:hypothetical protein
MHKLRLVAFTLLLQSNNSGATVLGALEALGMGLTRTIDDKGLQLVPYLGVVQDVVGSR